MFITFALLCFPVTLLNLKVMKKHTKTWLVMIALKRLRYAEKSSIELTTADSLLK
jgi:hypothetical protein